MCPMIEFKRNTFILVRTDVMHNLTVQMETMKCIDLDLITSINRYGLCVLRSLGSALEQRWFVLYLPLVMLY